MQKSIEDEYALKEEIFDAIPEVKEEYLPDNYIEVKEEKTYIKNENIINDTSRYEEKQVEKLTEASYHKTEEQKKSKIAIYLNEFFTENLLAKIG
jgi:hypothetical protein